MQLQKTVSEEEQVYEETSNILFSKLFISPELFERSQQMHMQDPSVQMELFNLGIKMEQPFHLVVQFVMKSNDYAFDLFKKEYTDIMIKDPMMMPVLISTIAHDWVYKNH